MAEHITTTPSGIEIKFEDGLPDPDTGKSKRRCYWIDGEKLPSVTTILGMLEKPGLQWAAEKLTVAAAIELAREGELPLHVDGALSRMGARGLRFRQVWDTKGQRGTVSHDDLLKLAQGQQVLDLDTFPVDQQGFIRGVSAWVADYRPVVKHSELMVASVDHGFAGRLDMRAEVHGLPGVGLVDLKTTEALPRYKSGEVKAPYPEHLLQLAAYELACTESGYGSSDWQAVVRVDAQGDYDFCASWVDGEQFLAILDAYKALKGAKTRPKVAA